MLTLTSPIHMTTSTEGRRTSFFADDRWSYTRVPYRIPKKIFIQFYSGLKNVSWFSVNIFHFQLSRLNFLFWNFCYCSILVHKKAYIECILNVISSPNFHRLDTIIKVHVLTFKYAWYECRIYRWFFDSIELVS